MSAWTIACCGCSRILMSDGTPGVQVLVDGIIRLPIMNETNIEIGSFETKQAADAAASKAGWSVADDEGPNHRCPECREKYIGFLARLKAQILYDAEPRGAYIELDQLLPPTTYTL